MNGWTRAFLLKNDDDAHEALSLSAQRDGVPEVMVTDGDKAQLRECGVHVKKK
jgi:hypothetical protein